MKTRLPLRALARSRTCATAFALSLGATAPAFAQTNPAKPASTDEVVQMEAFSVTTTIGAYHEETSSMANKLPTNLKELASSLQILNANAIGDRSAVSLQDVFNYVVGATQSQGNINGFSFRGFANVGSYTQNIQFDGLMGATLKKGASSASNVESLEFLKGPNSVLYGQMNPGGLLNIVSKSPKEIRQTIVRATMGTYAGSYNSFGDKTTNTVTLDTTGPIDAGKHLLYRLVIDTGSVPTSRPGNYDRYLSLYPSLTYQWSKGTYLSLKFEKSQDNRRQDDGVVPIFTGVPTPVSIAGVPTLTAAYGANSGHYTAKLNTVYQDLKDKARDYGEAAALYFRAALPADWTFRLQTRSVWHVDFVREFTVNNANVYSPTSTYATPNSLLRRQYNQVINGHRYNFFDSNAYRSFGPEKFKNTVLIGAGGGAEFFGNQRFAFGPNLTPAQATTFSNPVIDLYPWPADGTGIQSQKTWQTMFGEYISDQLKIGDRFHLSGGVRHDRQLVHGIDTFNPARTPYFTQTVKATTSQLGAVFDVTSNISTYGSWSTSIKPAATIAVDQFGNSSFPPEKGEQFEGGVKIDTSDKKLFFAIAAYKIDRTNVLVASGTNLPNGQAISRIDGKQESTGYEFETQWQPLPYWQVQAGLALSKALIKESAKNPQSIGLDLANAPRHTANFWTRYNVPSGDMKGLGVGVGVIYVGQGWAGDPTTAVYYQLPGWTRVDTSVFYKWKRYDFSLNVQNLLDRRYIASAQSAITLNVGEQRKFTFSAATRF